MVSVFPMCIAFPEEFPSFWRIHLIGPLSKQIKIYDKIESDQHEIRYAEIGGFNTVRYIRLSVHPYLRPQLHIKYSCQNIRIGSFVSLRITWIQIPAESDLLKSFSNENHSAKIFANPANLIHWQDSGECGGEICIGVHQSHLWFSPQMIAYFSVLLDEPQMIGKFHFILH